MLRYFKKNFMSFIPKAVDEKRKFFDEVKARKESHEKWIAENLGFQVGDLMYCQQPFKAPKVAKIYNSNLQCEVYGVVLNENWPTLVTINKKDLVVYLGFEVLISLDEKPLLSINTLHNGCIVGLSLQKDATKIKQLMEKRGVFGQPMNYNYGQVILGHNDVKKVDRFILKEYFDNHFRKVK